jgi:hypothetical protein
MQLVRHVGFSRNGHTAVASALLPSNSVGGYVPGSEA